MKKINTLTVIKDMLNNCLSNIEDELDTNNLVGYAMSFGKESRFPNVKSAIQKAKGEGFLNDKSLFFFFKPKSRSKENEEQIVSGIKSVFKKPEFSAIGEIEDGDIVKIDIDGRNYYVVKIEEI